MSPTQLTADQKLRIAQKYQQAGRLEQAEALGRQVLAAEPKSAEALFLRGAVDVINAE